MQILNKPIGLVSKKRIGVHRIVSNICLCKFLDALIHKVKNKLDLNEARIKTKTMITKRKTVILKLFV
jgi:hypothetical protein